MLGPPLGSKTSSPPLALLLRVLFSASSCATVSLSLSISSSNFLVSLLVILVIFLGSSGGGGGGSSSLGVDFGVDF